VRISSAFALVSLAFQHLVLLLLFVVLLGFGLLLGFCWHRGLALLLNFPSFFPLRSPAERLYLFTLLGFFALPC